MARDGGPGPRRLDPGVLLLKGDLRSWELKRLHYRLLHQPGRIARYARRTTLRLARDWPWAKDLAAAFARLQAPPPPATA